MSRLEKLIYNPHNYKNFCNVFEANSETCDGCTWKVREFTCEIPIYDRSTVMGVLYNVTS